MTGLQDATDALSAALDGVDGVRHYRQLWGPVDPPASVLALASYRWGAYSPEPTDAVFRVALVAAAHDRAFEQLLELEGRVVAALHAVDGVAVTNADLRPYSVSGTDYPAVVFDVDFSL